MLLHIITIVFVVLKLTGYIAWSWWLVLLPSILAILIILCAVLFSAWFVMKVGSRKGFFL